MTMSDILSDVVMHRLFNDLAEGSCKMLIWELMISEHQAAIGNGRRPLRWVLDRPAYDELGRAMERHPEKMPNDTIPGRFAGVSVVVGQPALGHGAELISG